jgi:hypothetical protein
LAESLGSQCHTSGSDNTRSFTTLRIPCATDGGH